MQKKFSDPLAAARIAQNDPRAIEALTQAQNSCEAGNIQAAEAVLDRAATVLEAPETDEPQTTTEPQQTH
jgi:hypothetical protein